MSLDELRKDAYRKVLLLRSIERLLSSYEFELAYAIADKEERQVLESWIAKFDNDAIKKWIKEKNTDEPTTRQLRLTASRLGISNYSRLDKHSLMSAISKKEAENGRANQNGIQSDFRSETSSV